MGVSLDEKGLGQRLQDARRAAGLTQQDLCHKASLSYSTLAKIERGAIKSPSIFTIQNIAAALNVGLDSLLGVAVPSPSVPQVKPKLTAQTGVKFVYFDINGCLVRFFHAAFTKLAADSQVPASEVETAFWHYNDEVCRGTLSMDSFNAAFADRLHIPKLNWQDYYLDAIEPIPEMHALVAWAAERYHVGLLSNIMPGFIDTMRQRGILPDVPYDVIIDSSQVGSIKPERRIYEIATERSQKAPGEILLVDDDRSNLMAAERFGWHVLWVDSYRAHESVDRIQEALKPVQ
jgi:FMN phosphatase YigB (HAD superfamily)